MFYTWRDVIVTCSCCLEGSSSNSSCVVSVSYSLCRYIRREKQISDTKMEMSQSQKIRLQESCDHLQRKLTETEKMLSEERERNTMNMKSAEEHKAILAKVREHYLEISSIIA